LYGSFLDRPNSSAVGTVVALAAIEVRCHGGVLPAKSQDRDRERPRELLERLRLAVWLRRPPLRPPLRDAERFSFFPRPEPLFFPPPLSLFTVAQARRAASLLPVPRFS
jgi:hypothetical protein